MLTTQRVKRKMSDKNNSEIQNPKRNMVYGLIFISFGVISFCAFFFAAILSKLLPTFQNPILLAIQNDRYYCFLVPLTLPMVIIAIYFHWLSMKLFKHA
ncbi:hypothetical protein LUZ60_003609 [Juncus effusus]|nr:hypothetical protein LUZ60_003609 [Juncus effusus]